MVQRSPKPHQLGFVGLVRGLPDLGALHRSHAQNLASVAPGGIGLACVLLVIDFDLATFSIRDSAVLENASADVLFYLFVFGLLAIATIGFFWIWGVIDRRRAEKQQLVYQRVEMAATVERIRIAREMHDIVARNLAGIMALADGARYAATKDPAVAVDALETINAHTRASLAQMRGLLSVLRDDTARDHNAAPGVDKITALFAEARRKEVDLTVTGLRELSVNLSELTQFTLYRVIQELLTNIILHSDGKKGDVEFTVAEGILTITATNPVSSNTASTRGFGLTGIAERLNAHGCKFSSSRNRDTFTAIARLPTGY